MRAVLLVLLCFVVACWASCHHSCSQHGECIDNECECENFWVGDDCSIPFLPLADGDTVSDSVHGDWAYYYTEIDDDVTKMTYHLTDGLLGDCDLYVRYNNFPSKHHNDYSNNGWGSSSSIAIENPQEGVWVVGIYNFLSCSYTLSFNLEKDGSCLNDCSDHGTCGLDNVCICDDLWAGEDCSNAMVDLAAETAGYSEEVGKWQWNWYYYDAVAVENDVPDFQVVVNQTAADNCDTDLYIKLEELPVLWDYDYRNAIVADNYAISVGSPATGRYYIGVYGYNTPSEDGTCAYNIHLGQANEDPAECESRCSSHGFCSHGVCQCSEQFEGDQCERMTVDLMEGQSVSGFANNNQWNFYTATANSAANMLISVDQDWNEGGDCDLYIRANEQPDRFNYDYRNIGFDNSFTVVVQNPLSTTWHIGVYGYRHCQYYLMETIDANTCPNDCSEHGSCVNGRCNCDSNFAGQDCASPLGRIHSQDLVEGAVGQNKWSYYKYTAPASHTSVAVELIETETQGSLALYVLEGAPPELTGAQYSDEEASRLHTVYFLFDGTQDVDHDFYIGVYGTSLVTLGSPVPYELFVYSPPI